MIHMFQVCSLLCMLIGTYSCPDSLEAPVLLPLDKQVTIQLSNVQFASRELMTSYRYDMPVPRM